VTNHGTSLQRMSQLLEGLIGATLVAIGIKELWL
jgi:hypothetical protein